MRARTLFALAASLSCHAPPAAAQQPVAIGTTYTLSSTVLGQTRRINVYLPPSYAEGDKSYPVLYLLDGGVQEDFFHIAGIASLAADFRNIREFIVVGIEGIDRYHDMTSPSTVASDRERLPTSGGATAFRSFLAGELKPYVEQHFRVTDETVLIGESMAGLFVTETFLKQPDLFAGYIAVSPSVWWDAESLVRGADSLLQKPFPPYRRLYLTIANEGGEMRHGVDLLVGALKAHPPADLDWTFAPMEQEIHGTIFHPAALAAVRKFFAAPTTHD